MAEKRLELKDCLLTDEKIKKTLATIEPDGFNWTDITDIEMTKFKAISQSQLNKIKEAGWKSPEEIQQQVAEAVKKERETIIGKIASNAYSYIGSKSVPDSMDLILPFQTWQELCRP